MNYKLNDEIVAQPVPPSPPLEVLSGKYISLEPLVPGDNAVFTELFECSHGDERRERVWQFLPYGTFDNAATMADYYHQMQAAGEAQFYIVRHLSNNQAAGMVSYLRIIPMSYSIEIGHIWHAVDMQRGRANTEASFLLIKNAFDLGYRRLEWKCNALNMKSRQAALRLGLAFEGIFRQCTVTKNKNRDTSWFALLDKDWAAAKQNFIAWLDAPLGEVSLAGKNLPLVKGSLAAHDNLAV